MKTLEEQMRILFNVYYNECMSRRISYTAQEKNQSWIVMDGIELSYMYYQGEYQPIFMCARYSDELGDDVYFFKNYKDCEMVWNMNETQLNEYVKSITI